MILVIAAAFIVGTLMANPVVEAAGGWKLAIENIKTYTVTQNVTPAPGGGFASAGLQCNTGDFMTGWFWDDTGSTALAKDLRYITMNSNLDVNGNLIGGQIVVQNTGATGGGIDLAIICLSK